MEKISVLSESTADPDPFRQFSHWYNDRLKTEIAYPDAVCLATSSNEGKPSARIVLLKEFSNKGFVFFTNHRGRKGRQIESNPAGALLFYWPESSRQVRIEGRIFKISEAESIAYFSTRPRESQIGAWASDQSSPIPDRQYLEDRFSRYEALFAGRPVTRPDFWGGFRLVPEWFEFWQEGEFRLHDRITYTKNEGGWIKARLSP